MPQNNKNDAAKTPEQEAAEKEAADKAQAEKEAADAKAAADAQAEVDAKASLESRLEKLELEAAERANEVQRLRTELAQKSGSKEPIAMRATAFNAEKSREQIKKIWPRDSERLGEILNMPVPLGKTFLVTPLGDAAGNMLPAIVSNCADEGDAKREYFAKTGAVPHKLQVSVEPVGETKRIIEEQQQALEAMHTAKPDELAEFREFQRQSRRQRRA